MKKDNVDGFQPSGKSLVGKPKWRGTTNAFQPSFLFEEGHVDASPPNSLHLDPYLSLDVYMLCWKIYNAIIQVWSLSIWPHIIYGSRNNLYGRLQFYYTLHKILGPGGLGKHPHFNPNIRHLISNLSYHLVNWSEKANKGTFLMNQYRRTSSDFPY